MLELYFDLRSVLKRHRHGPLAPHMDSLASALHQRGYARQTARLVLVRASSRLADVSTPGRPLA